MSETHAAPFLGHMRQPQTFLHRQLAQTNQLADIITMLLWIHLIAVSEWLNRRFDVILNKVPHLRTNGFVFWRQSEINHVLPPYISSFERAIHCDANPFDPSCPIVTKVGDSEIPIEPKSRLA